MGLSLPNTIWLFLVITAGGPVITAASASNRTHRTAPHWTASPVTRGTVWKSIPIEAGRNKLQCDQGGRQPSRENRYSSVQSSGLRPPQIPTPLWCVCMRDHQASRPHWLVINGLHAAECQACSLEQQDRRVWSHKEHDIRWGIFQRPPGCMRARILCDDGGTKQE